MTGHAAAAAVERVLAALSDHSSRVEERGMPGTSDRRDMNRGELLALSDERDRQAARELDAARRGYRRGHADGSRDGYEAGRADEQAELSRAWREHARRVLALADPQGPEARDSAAARVARAVARERADAERHFRSFMARAANTSDRDRTEVQAAALRLGPRRRRGAA